MYLDKIIDLQNGGIIGKLVLIYLNMRQLMDVGNLQ